MTINVVYIPHEEQLLIHRTVGESIYIGDSSHWTLWDNEEGDFSSGTDEYNDAD